MALASGNIIIAFVVMMIIGVCIGLLSGLLGIGGGVLMIPVFRLVLGLSPLASTGSSLLTIILTSATGSVARIRTKTNVPKLSIIIGLGGALLSPWGAQAANVSPSVVVMCACALCMTYSGISMLKSARNPKDEAHVYEIPTLKTSDYAKAFFVGMSAGFASGYVGVGGGFIIMPLLLQVFHLSMKLATGTSLLAVMILAIPGAITQVIMGNAVIWVCIATAIGAIPGAILGSKLVTKISEKRLSIFMFVFMIIGACLLVLNELL